MPNSSMKGSIYQLSQRATGLINGRTLGVVAAFSAKVAGAGLGFLFSIMLARLLGPVGIGIFFLALTIVSIGATIARLGLNNAIIRFASVAYDQDDAPTLAALYRKSLWLVIVAGVVVSIIVWLVVPFLSLGGDRSSEMHVALYVMLFAIVPTSLILLQGEFFKATGAPGTATFVQAVLMPMFLVMGTAVLYWRGGAVVLDIALLYVIAAIISVLLVGAAWSHLKPGFWAEHGHFDTRLLLRTSLPLLWVASMSLLMGWTDILILGVWTDAATVGVYGIAARVSALTAFILIAVNSVTAPRFAAFHAQGNHKALERLAQHSAGWMLLAASPVILFFLVFPEWILQLFGTDFVGGVLILRILVLGQLVNVAMGSVGYLLMMTGYEKLMRNIIMLAALLNFAGNLILVPTYGAMGAAVSTSFSLVFLNLVTHWLVWLRLRINVFGYLLRESQ